MLPTALHALVLALLHFVWQGALVGALALLVDRALRSAPAALRYAALHACLWTMAIAFAWTYAWLLRDAIGASAVLASPTGMAAPELHMQEIVAVPLLLAWSAGASWRGIRLALGLAGVARWRGRAVALPPVWAESLGELAIAMGVRARVGIAALAGIDAPIVIGVLRPLVLVPLSYAAGVPTVAMRAALGHELAHVLRHDYLLQLLHGTIEAVLFYHPCVRWLGARLRVEREYCCDDLVTAKLFDPLDYARALAELEGARMVPSPALAATGASLLHRIERLLQPISRGSSRVHIRTAAVTAWLGLALAVTPAVLAPACVAGGDDVDPDAATAQREAARPGERAPIAAAPGAAVLPVAWLAEPLAAHAGLIDAAAKRHGVDPSLLAIVTWVESHGDARARSPSGARGLMQLMPRTAQQIASERQLAGYDEARLDDPAYNLDLGAYHLAQLIEEYGAGDELDADTVALAAAAYNGGRKRVDAWLGGAALPDETEHYKDVVVELWQARELERAPQLTSR
jgi:soluble lytic murein transglycosylase-like protein